MRVANLIATAVRMQEIGARSRFNDRPGAARAGTIGDLLPIRDAAPALHAPASRTVRHLLGPCSAAFI